MARVVHLHVGAPKTGTTYLQDRLFLNRDTLADHDVHYPVGSHHADMFGAAVDLLDVPWGGQREGFRGEWAQLANRVRRVSGTALVSHEILAGATSAQAARAWQDLGVEAELHLVLSARDIGRQVPAEWQESVKHRRQWTFARFLRTVMTGQRRDSRDWFWKAQSLPDVLNRWVVDLPPERVHVVTVPPAGGDPGELWRRYCRAFDLDPAWLPVESTRANASIGAAETTLLRQLNKRLRSAGLDSATYRVLIRQMLVHDSLALRENMTRVTLPPQAMPWARDVAEEWIEWIRGAGIDVVGDVEDLRPAEPEEPWRNPDRPRRRELNDAALDALAAVVMELAVRHEHDVNTVLGRAARRLRGQ